ncbi:Transposable element P transposase [Frankliniella fusca]|uniref:Transposable element P transposase n=1 Tax=Frankliniella fusca TaxID=407009 RepID=A0AAE1H5N4_9NEOP|nr:Transposable element P transposase [Frankliniella fusca]
MRIKGHALYKKLIRDNKLPLPSEKTLNKYMKGLKAEYGFQDNIFKVMGLKGKSFDPSERHGCLLLDEMQLDALLTYRADLCKVHGFVDLGKYTPSEQREKQGDHGLVLMFQPFKGQWVQTLGAFLSSAAVPGHILRKMIVEAIVLLYNQGFTVDIVTTDGARWNRAMWKLAGVNITSSCTEHPGDKNKKLWFASDFPHLVKTMWTRVVSRKEMSLPDGVIKLSHWETVIKHNEKLGIKQCWTLKSDHLKPSNYQKMNVKMAFEFFGSNVLSSMKYLKERNIYPELEDSGPTIKFIERMGDLIKAMNAKDVLHSLKASPDCPQNKILTDFLDYLSNMHEISKVKHPYGPRSKKVVPQGSVVKQRKTKTSEERIFVGASDEFTTDAFLGLTVTVRATLELVKYLTEEVGFKFLMTRRLNQDALEHFFGEIRTACGSGSHPDPLLFIQLYRLLSLYSLVKPPKGSNVSGGELFQALVQLQDLENNENQEDKQKVVDIINSIVEESGFAESPDETCTNFNPETSACNIDEAALCLIAGYISFKVKNMKPANSCSVCAESLVRPNSESSKERERLIEIKSLGGLLRPSDLVYAIIIQVEQAVIFTSTQENLHTNMIFSILENVRDHATLYRIGCDEHQQALTSAIVTFYLTVRMHFQCREMNKQTAMNKKKNKNMSKMAKLQSTLAATGSIFELESSYSNSSELLRPSSYRPEPQNPSPQGQTDKIFAPRIASRQTTLTTTPDMRFDDFSSTFTTVVAKHFICNE